jgi:hypothetical protein
MFVNEANTSREASAVVEVASSVITVGLESQSQPDSAIRGADLPDTRRRQTEERPRVAPWSGLGYSFLSSCSHVALMGQKEQGTLDIARV